MRQLLELLGKPQRVARVPGGEHGQFGFGA
jgi:hypothetical protein